MLVFPGGSVVKNPLAKVGELQKNIYFCSLNKLKPLTVYHNKLWKILKETEYQTTRPAS